MKADPIIYTISTLVFCIFIVITINLITEKETKTETERFVDFDYLNEHTAIMSTTLPSVMIWTEKYVCAEMSLPDYSNRPHRRIGRFCINEFGHEQEMGINVPEDKYKEYVKPVIDSVRIKAFDLGLIESRYRWRTK